MKGIVIKQENLTKLVNTNVYPIKVLKGTFRDKYFIFENQKIVNKELFKNIEYEEVDLSLSDFQKDYTIPEPNAYYLEVLPEFLGVFKDNKFVFGQYEIPLYEIDGKKCVNTIHFGWQQFRNDLDELLPDGTFRHKALKDVLMPLWDNLALQNENQDYIVWE